MRSEVAKRMMAKMPEDVKIFADKYADLVVLINQLLREQGINQKTLAAKLGKQPSEIHKWLSGEHNFTLKSLCKLEAELGHELLVVPSKKTAHQYAKGKKVGHLTVYSSPIHRQELPAIDTWHSATQTKKQLANVG
ncbi:helix-turn-helix domain-containing protein [Phnomibacter sp. MR]|uniref:helix-turn-helix domain-containing protein n=1 Tax=Phnomibacter sp. MR TaxID=3042318 RepID=UPI003A80BBD1